MVFEVTTEAFPQPLVASGDDSSHNAASSSTPSTVPTTGNRPAKRRRVVQPGATPSGTTPSPAPTPALDLDALDAARRRAAGRVMSLWESLAEKYARGIDEDDEIDILTGKIYKDRGVLRSVSERGWKIGSFGEALEVEPIVTVSGGETDTGASEADDEGEGEDDTEGEGVDDPEESEEDPLGGWSYDWQYRAVPPPRPELSPQDAEDLKEFLAAEQMIQENLRQTGRKVDNESDEDEDITYMGTSLTDLDGTLRSEDNSDDEFASMMVDSSTVRYIKDEDEEDDEEPAASILGDLATGSTSQKTTSNALTDVEDRKDTVQLPGLDAKRHTPDAGSSQRTVLAACPVTVSGASSEAGVEDDLIIIDSDSDDDVETVVTSMLKSTLSLNTPSKPSAMPPTTPATPHAKNLSTSKAPAATAGPSARSSKATKSSNAMKTPLRTSGPQVSATKASPSSNLPLQGGRSKPGAKPTSKRAQTALPKARKEGGSGRSRDHAGDPASGTIVSPKMKAGSSVSPSKSGASKGSTNRSDGLPDPVQGQGKSVAPRAQRTVSTGGIRTECGVDNGLDAMTRSGPAPQPESPNQERAPPAPTASKPISIRPKSPIKPRKKTAVLEVVLPTPKRVSKIKHEPAASPGPAKLGDVRPTATTSPSSTVKQSHPQGIEPTPGLRTDSTTATTSTQTIDAIRDDTTTPGSTLKRKRGPETDECVNTAANTVGPRAHGGQVEHTHTCCPPAPLGQNPNAICCAAHFQYQGNLPAHPHVYSHPHSAHQAQHYPTVPVYQHQHQHLHTHLPFPLPQLPFTANELTEAAFKLMYGLSALNQTSGTHGSSGPGIWLPPGAHIPFELPIGPQAGPSSRNLAPKLEASSSQNRILSTEERIPSSQEYERKMEEESQKADAEKRSAGTGVRQPPVPEPQSSHPLPQLEKLSLERPRTPSSPINRVVAPVAPANTPPMPHASTSKREMSVIDIDSDSDDELAGYNVGEGSMRWEPPIKDEVHSDVDASLDLSAEFGDSLRSKRRNRQPRARESPVKGASLRRASPVKSKRL